MSREKTLNEILYNSKSIARFGDGEFNIIFGKNIGFQEFNETLRKKLLKVLNSSFPNLLVGLMNLVYLRNKYWINWIEKNKIKLLKVINKINKNKTYYSSGITRFYSPSNKKYIKNYITRFKSIWNNRDILIIEGEKTTKLSNKIYSMKDRIHFS